MASKKAMILIRALCRGNPMLASALKKHFGNSGPAWPVVKKVWNE